MPQRHHSFLVPGGQVALEPRPACCCGQRGVTGRMAWCFYFFDSLVGSVWGRMVWFSRDFLYFYFSLLYCCETCDLCTRQRTCRCAGLALACGHDHRHGPGFSRGWRATVDVVVQGWKVVADVVMSTDHLPHGPPATGCMCLGVAGHPAGHPLLFHTIIFVIASRALR